MTPLAGHLAYAVAWLSFGALHSLLARQSVKARLRPLLGPWYRFAYNGLSVVHLAFVWGIGWLALGGAGAFDLPGWARGLLLAGEIAGWLLMVAALVGYDLGRMGGMSQIRHHRLGITAPEDEPLRTDGLHRFVRHPIYSAGFLILWGRVGNEFELATAVWGSLYLAIGALFEERWLLDLYGTAYADYRRQVPAFVPWRGRAI